MDFQTTTRIALIHEQELINCAATVLSNHTSYGLCFGLIRLVDMEIKTCWNSPITYHASSNLTLIVKGHKESSGLKIGR
jgi:hypothetical protein